MATTKVSHLNLTVTTIDVFIQTMKFIEMHDLWDDARACLKANKRTEMFFDYDILCLFREMLKEANVVSEDDPVFRILIGHGGHGFDCSDESS